MKFQSGALVLSAESPTFTPRTPAQLQAMAAQHGVPARIVPAYAGDRAMVGRAISGTATPGWLVKAVTTTKTRVCYAIASIDKDPERDRIDYAHTAHLEWTSEGGNGTHITGQHPVAQQINATYQGLRGLVFAGDWTEKIIDYIRDDCAGQALREQGVAYWVPPPHTGQLTALRAMLAEVGIALYVAEIETANVGDVRQAAQQGLAEQIEALRQEVEGFDGTQTASVYTNRLAQLAACRRKLLAYQAAVGAFEMDLTGLLAAIDHKVTGHLTARLDTVLKKDGTRARKHGASVADQAAQLVTLVAQGELALARALTAGTLTVDVERAALLALLEEQEPPADEPGPAFPAYPEPPLTHEPLPHSANAEATAAPAWEQLLDELNDPDAAGEIPATW